MFPKYAPLVQYLAVQSVDRVTLTLAEIEAIIGAPLPVGARGRRWWQIPLPSQTAPLRLMREAGWRIVLDGFWGRTPVVTFVRDGSDAASAGLP